VQGKDFIARDDSPVTLDDYDITDGAALQAQLHQVSSVFRGESYVDETGKSTKAHFEKASGLDGNQT
jgi:hypothetical protein